MDLQCYLVTYDISSPDRSRQVYKSSGCRRRKWCDSLAP